jgi:hypothetical protein
MRQTTNPYKISDETPTPLGPEQEDLRRDRNLNRTGLQFGCPMLESGRDLSRLNPRRTLRIHSERKLQRDQRVNDQGKVRNKTYNLRGGQVREFIENGFTKNPAGLLRVNAGVH